MVIAAEMTSAAAAAEASGIPRKTLAYWLDDPEFAPLRQKTRQDMADEASALAHKVLGEISRRLDEFEPRDMAILFGVLVDKGQLLSGEATSRTEHRELLNDFDDHEKGVVADWLRELVRERLVADAVTD